MGLSTKPTEPLNCPRCESTKTKFCYYNNYNKSQPRHFCKGCKRHWTQGGILRNVPIGGLKNKRPLKITSTSRDDIGEGQGECKASSTLCHEIFNPPCPAPTISGSTREKSNFQMVVVQSKQNYDQNFPLVTSNIDEEKNIFDNFPSSSLPYDIIDTMFKGSIGTIPCSNIYNYMGNLDCALEDYSTITWQGPTRTSSVMDIEALVATDEFNIAWDDTEIKP